MLFAALWLSVCAGNAQFLIGINENYCFNDDPAQITINASGATLSGPGITATISGYIFTPASAGVGTHTLVLSFGDNNTGTNTFNTTVVVYPNPEIPTISPAGVVNIFEGEVLTLTSSASIGNLWIPGEQTTQSIEVTQQGQYRVRVTNEAGCSALSLRTTVFVNPIVVEPPPVSGCYANEVVSYLPAKRNDGSDIPEANSDPSNALGQAQNNNTALPNGEVSYVSLGFGGSITLKMEGPIKNGLGDDLQVVETTFLPNDGRCNRYPERVKAFASQDGCHWVYLGEGCQDATFDLGPLNWALYIRLVDSSPIGAAYNNQVADGYDVDGLVCLNGIEDNPELQDLGADYAVDYLNFNQGLRKNNTQVLANRSNPMQALGAPENTDQINFVSLGFGGTITLKLGYVVFDKPGDDIMVVETSFGNPVCNAYAEKALIEVSLDNNIYYNVGEICLDGSIDFAAGGAIAAQYIRITDRSFTSNFGSTADGFDVDGIVVLQPGCESGSDARVIGDNVNIADETAYFDIYPNPFQNLLNLNIATQSDAEQLNIKVINIAGQVVHTRKVNVASYSNLNEVLDLSSFNSGVYFITLESKNLVETHKVIKQ